MHNPKSVLIVGQNTHPFVATQDEMNDYQFHWVISGWDALERVQSGSSPDLIVLDSVRNESEAMHTLRWLRRIQPGLPVVLIGPRENFSLRHEAMRAGAQDYLFSTHSQSGWELLVRLYLQKGAQFFDQERRGPDIEQVGEDLFFVAASPVTSKLRAQIEL